MSRLVSRADGGSTEHFWQPNDDVAMADVDGSGSRWVRWMQDGRLWQHGA